MKLISCITDCVRFAVYNKSVVYIDTEKNLRLGEKIFTGHYFGFYVIRNLLLTINNETNKTEVFDLNTYKLVFSNSNTFIIRPDLDMRVNSLNILGQFMSDFEWALFSLEDFSLVKDLPKVAGKKGAAFLVSDHFFFSLDMVKIAGFNISNNQMLWEKSYAELFSETTAKRTGKVLALNDKVYIQIKNFEGSSHVLFCLDAATGQVVHEYANYGFFFELNGNIIYGAHTYSAALMDTISNKVALYNFKDILEPKDFFIHDGSSVLTADSLIYFIDGGVFAKSTFGILDIKNHKLIETVKLKIKSKYKRINSLKVIDQNVYVHADDNTLYIYER